MIRHSFRPGSLTLRVAVATALFGLLVAAGAMIVGYWTLSRQLDERSGSEIEGRRQLLELLIAEIPTVEAVRQSGERIHELFFGHQDLHLTLLEPDAQTILGGFASVGPDSVSALRETPVGPLHTWRTKSGQRFTGIHGVAKVADGHDIHFHLSVDRAGDSKLLAGFVNSALLVIPLLLLTVAVGAGLIARTGLAPLRHFHRVAASVGAKSLSKRLSLADLPVELAEMATEFNGMLERIDEGYRQLEDYSGDLAHEVRTPVATLLGQTQVALSQPRSREALREVLEKNVDELMRLGALIEDMLFLARADHKAAPLQPEHVDLSAEAMRVGEYLGILGEDKDVRIEVTGHAPVLMADRLLVERTLTNLMTNAVRHAYKSTVVTVTVGSEDGQAKLCVTNRGDEIPAAALARIFERFYRVDHGRARGDGGTGLGLAIVRSIAKLHGGAVTVRSSEGATTFTLSLPLAGQKGGESKGPAPESSKVNHFRGKPFYKQDHPHHSRGQDPAPRIRKHEGHNP